MPSCSPPALGLASQPELSIPTPPLPASIEDDLSRSTISLVLDAFFRFTVAVAKKAGNKVVGFGVTKDELFVGDGEEGYEPPNTDVDAGVDVGEENEAGFELDERLDPALVTRRGPGDNDLDLAESVNCELAASDESELSPRTGPVLSPIHPAVGLDRVLPSDGERGSEDEDEEGEMGVTGSQNPCESFRSPGLGLVGGGEERLSINAGLSPETEQASPLLGFILELSSTLRLSRVVDSFADDSDDELTGVTVLPGVVCADIPRLDRETDVCDNDPCRNDPFSEGNTTAVFEDP